MAFERIENKRAQLAEEELKLEAETRRVNDKEKTLEKDKNKFSSVKKIAKKKLSHELEEASNHTWHSTLLIGLILLVLGYAFPKFIEKHYD